MMKKETRLDLAMRLMHGKLHDIKESSDGKHLCFYGQMLDGRYFAAIASNTNGLHHRENHSAMLEGITRLEVDYCPSLDSAAWHDERHYMQSQCGYFNEELLTCT